MLIFILWYYWNKWSIKRLLKKYDPKKDLAKLAEDKRNREWNHNGNKTKQGGEQDAGVGKEESDDGTATKDSDGFEQPKGRKLLQTTEVVDDGKTSNSNRKNGSGIRKLLGRRRK